MQCSVVNTSEAKLKGPFEEGTHYQHFGIQKSGNPSLPVFVKRWSFKRLFFCVVISTSFRVYSVCRAQHNTRAELGLESCELASDLVQDG